MKNLLILAALAAGSYGIYRYLNTITPAVDAVNPANQLKQGKAAEDIARSKMSQVTVESIQRAVNGFRDANGRLPASLQELMDKGMIDSIPAGIVYDPATGVVSAG